MHLKGVSQMAALVLHFRNGTTLVQRMRAGEPCDEVVLWDGTRISHPPGREGLMEALTEVWLEHVYTAGFYRPADKDVIVDAGANVGIFAIQMARQNPRCRVIALEPFPENFRYLEANVARCCPENVICREVALGGRFGKGQMLAEGSRSLDHVLRVEEAETRGAALAGAATDVSSIAGTSIDGATTDGVEVIPLAGLFELARIYLSASGEIDFLKVDIEGSERDVFAAASPDVLGRFKRIALEYHDQIVPGTLDLLRRVLNPTHEVTVRPSKMEGCGILLAQRRGLKN
jgi:FkbM family methyltransferase